GVNVTPSDEYCVVRTVSAAMPNSLNVIVDAGDANPVELLKNEASARSVTAPKISPATRARDARTIICFIAILSFLPFPKVAVVLRSNTLRSEIMAATAARLPRRKQGEREPNPPGDFRGRILLLFLPEELACGVPGRLGANRG